MPVFPLVLLTLFIFGSGFSPSLEVVEAGCGCSKPPPPPAPIRPNAAYAGAPVTLFFPDLQSEQAYTVIFTSSVTGRNVSVQSMAIIKRDLADGVYRPQLTVSAPSLPLGPVSIEVRDAASESVLATVDDASFTIAPTPVTVSSHVGKALFQGFQAAVSRDGTVYVSLDMTQVETPMTFHAQAKGYPLRFTDTDVVFYNIQGFLMQLLTQGIPGLFTIVSPSSSADSNILRYSRHEFVTYYVQHQERQPHQLDPTDPNWHLDGSYHVDHNHLILALAGQLANGSAPQPGATPPFDLELDTFSFFLNGLVGKSSVWMTDDSSTDSFNSRTRETGAQGDILSNNLVTLSKDATVNGDATAKTFTILDNAKVKGNEQIATVPVAFLPVVMPKGLMDLGNVDVFTDQLRTIRGPASYQIANLSVGDNGHLVIDNAQGPVTLYVIGNVTLSKLGSITTTDPNPEKFAIYGAKNGTISLSGQTDFHGVVYAPLSTVQLSDDGQFFGSYVGDNVFMQKSAVVHFDSALRGQ